MSDHSSPGSLDVSFLVPIFEALRKYDGLKPSRLRNSRVQPLLRLPAVQNHAALTGSKPETAAVEVVIEQVRRLPDVTDQIIADAVLGLAIFADAYMSHGLPQRVVRTLQVGSLGVRRTALLGNWKALHEALGAPAPGPPSDRKLRSPIEERVFGKLAELLLNTSVPAATASPTQITTTSRSSAQSLRATAAGKVIVVGGVAIDHIWLVRDIPEIETSTMAGNYARSPGGKGLSQAVAAARLGLDVSLIAAVTDDHDAVDILAHLEAEGVDTSLLKVMPGMRTPATGVLERPQGESTAAVWRNGVELDIPHLDRCANALSSCDVVLLTFEIPQKILYRTLNLATSSTERPPVIVVTPGQPYTDGYVSSEALKDIDYLVAHIWELERFSYTTQAKYDPQLLSDDLLNHGLKSLCILGNRGGTIYSRSRAPISISAPPSFLKESAITRDAFCAALAARLVEDHSLNDDAIAWAGAAMAVLAEDYHLAHTPPRRERVEQKFRESRGA
jgi:sugar/nucleoside kinase (ribokinase family)